MGIFGRKKEAVVASQVAPDATPDVAPEVIEVEIPTVTPTYDPNEWRDRVLNAVSPLPPSGMLLLDAVGLTLSETLVSDLDLPVATTATVAGYAIRTDDTRGASELGPVGLQVTQIPSELAVKPPALPSVGAMRVLAGAPLPDGADTVIPLSEATVSNNLLIVVGEPYRGLNLTWQGSDLGEGAVLATKGDVLTPGRLAQIAEAGYDKVLVRMRPRVVVLNCAPNSVEPGVPLANVLERYAAAALLIGAAAKMEDADVFVVDATSTDSDTVEAIVRDQLLRADVVISVGGLEPNGVLRNALVARNGIAEVSLHQASDQGFALVGESQTPWIMLPGKPYAAFVSYQMFARPVIRKLAGNDPLDWKTYESRVLSKFASANPTQVVPGIASAEGVTVVGDPQRPMIGDIAQANALIIVPEDVESVEVGQVCECWMLDDH